MHCATLAVCLLWSVCGEDTREIILESWRLCRASISMSQVVMEMRYYVWYRHSEPVVVVISVVIGDYCGVVL